jgi:hypothetical protein
VKQKRAVLISVLEEDGQLRMKLDDVVQVAEDENQWKYDVHYTSKLIPNSDLQEMKFSEKELADFGYHIMARLYAFNKRNEL